MLYKYKNKSNKIRLQKAIIFLLGLKKQQQHNLKYFYIWSMWNKKIKQRKVMKFIIENITSV